MKSVTSLVRSRSRPSDTKAVLKSFDHNPPIKDPRVLQLKPSELPPLPRVRDLLHVYGIRAKKNLSQNFLLRTRYLKALVRASGVMPGHRVIEIGPGPGNLTRTILERSPFEVITIEKDRRFLPLLEQLVDSVLPGQMRVLLGDIMNHDLKDIFGDPASLTDDYKLSENLPDSVYNFSRPWEDNSYPQIRIIGNLPFSISTALLIKWLHHISLRNSFWQYGRVPMLLTFQEEVARRICAEPTGYERTRLSAMSQNYCHPEYRFTIPGSAFTPKAGVDTGVVRFWPRKEPICKVPFKMFEKFVRHLYHHKSGSLQYNYQKLYPIEMASFVEEAFHQARVNQKILPCMVSNLELARLCDQYYHHCNLVPSLETYDYRANKKIRPEMTKKVLKDAGLDLLDSK